jgi:hypothetical protein
MKTYVYIWQGLAESFLNKKCCKQKRKWESKHTFGDIIIIIIITIITAIEFSLGDSSPYNSTVKTCKYKIYINETTLKQPKQYKTQ